MVAEPILAVNRQQSDQQIEEYIRGDIRLLLKFAYDEKRFANIQEITSHTLLSAIDKNWKELNITKASLWNE